MPEPFPLPTDAIIVKAAAGWAHCVSVTGIHWEIKIDFQFPLPEAIVVIIRSLMVLLLIEQKHMGSRPPV